MAAASPLKDSRRRIASAQRHIEHFEREARRWNATVDHARIVEPHTDGVNNAHKVALREPVSDLAGELAADALDNLRSALDLTMYAVAVAAGTVNPKNAYFPFASCPGELENTIKGRCKDLPEEIVAHLRALKPYKGGDDLLWALNRAAGSDKHRLIVPVGVVVGGTQIRHMRVSAKNFLLPAPTWDAEKNEIIFAVMSPDAKFEYDVNVAFGIAFDEIDVIGGKPVLGVLNALASKVAGIVNGIEAEARRLKLFT